MNVQVILLGYKARVGKDTIGNYLINEEKYKRFGFADKLKDVVSDLYSLSNDQVFGDSKDIIDERYNLSPRQILQDFGQEQRTRHRDIWSLYVANQIVSCVKNKTHNNFVITDFRFPNEYYSLQEHLKSNLEYVRVVPVRIVRPNLKPFAGMDDISEVSLDGFPDWTTTVTNDTTIDNLQDNFKYNLLDKGIVL